MKYLKLKDKNYRKIYKKKELSLFIYRCIFKNPFIFFKFKKLLILKWINLINSSNFFKFSNRCIFTNRGSSIYRIFGISRLELKRLASIGFLNGIQKSSW